MCEQLQNIKRKERENVVHSTLHYMFEAGIPFLQAFFCKLYVHDPSQPKEQVHVDALVSAIVTFCTRIVPFVSSQNTLKVIANAIPHIVAKSTLAESSLDELVDGFGKAEYVLSSLSLSDTHTERLTYSYGTFCVYCILHTRNPMVLTISLLVHTWREINYNIRATHCNPLCGTAGRWPTRRRSSKRVTANTTPRRTSVTRTSTGTAR